MTGAVDALALLSGLPVPQRAAVVARCYEGRDDQALADLLGVNRAQARRLLEDGLRRLSQMLPSAGPGHRPAPESPTAPASGR